MALAIYGGGSDLRGDRCGAFWIVVVAFFGVMALGPNLKIGGHE